MPTNQTGLIVEWPSYVDKPALPDGYSWHCLQKVPDKEQWWVRISWKMKDGKSRILKTHGMFQYPADAVSYASQIALLHYTKRGGQ